MADTFYVGRANNPYMVAGASLILPFFNICLALAGIGEGTLISRLLGAGEYTYRYAMEYAFCAIIAGGIPTVLSNVLSNLLIQFTGLPILFPGHFQAPRSKRHHIQPQTVPS